MCWMPLMLSIPMTGGGTFLILRFFLGRGTNLPEVANPGRTESMMVGVALASLGPLLVYFGATAGACRLFGIG